MRKIAAVLIVMMAFLGVFAASFGPAIAAPPPPPSPPPMPPPPGISGTVADAITGAYFSAPNVWLALYQVGWARSWVAGTDCSIGQGCAGLTGDFSFVGPYPAGKYEVEVWVANGRYLVLRHAFEYDGASANTGVLLVEPKPMLVGITAVSPSEIPSEGGGLEVEYEVCQNPAGIGGAVPYRARVSLIGTRSGGFYAENQTASHRGFVRNRVPVNKLRDTAEVSASPPDGSWICVRILVTDIGDPFKFFDETIVCIPKGFSNGPPWFEQKCSSPAPPPLPPTPSK